MMKRFICFFVVFLMLVCCQQARAQSYYTSTEYGVAFGASQYFGDLNEHYGFQTVAPSYGFYVRKHFNPYIAIKAVCNYTQVGYDDKYNADPYEKQRNLSFKSPVAEVALQAEFNFFKFVTGNYEHRFTPYLTAGLGVFYYNPYTTYNGVKYYLRPLGTEGQNMGNDNAKYANYAMCFPIGAGVKYWLRAGINLSFEVADRITTTDYLDDVSGTYVGNEKFKANNNVPGAYQLQDRSLEVGSVALGRPGKQRGNSSNNDQYIMGILSVSWHFTTYRCPQGLKYDLIKVH